MGIKLGPAPGTQEYNDMINLGPIKDIKDWLADQEAKEKVSKVTRAYDEALTLPDQEEESFKKKLLDILLQRKHYIKK